MAPPLPATGALLSIQVGLPATHDGWRTGYFKSPVPGPVRITRLNLEGDGQADRRLHGGPDKAVLGYAAAHYESWRRELLRPDLPYGAFAENLTLSGFDEDTVCLDDVMEVGEAVLQVSEPRGPCRNIGRRWEMPELTRLVAKSGRTGWYLRVLQEGAVSVGDRVRLSARTRPEETIARAGMRPLRRTLAF